MLFGGLSLHRVEAFACCPSFPNTSLATAWLAWGSEREAIKRSLICIYGDILKTWKLGTLTRLSAPGMPSPAVRALACRQEGERPGPPHPGSVVIEGEWGEWEREVAALRLTTRKWIFRERGSFSWEWKINSLKNNRFHESDVNPATKSYFYESAPQTVMKIICFCDSI
jgi:hypothetical protein